MNIIEAIKSGLNISKEAVEKLIQVGLQKEKREKLNKEQSKRLRSMIGQLAWIAKQTHSEIAFDVCQLSINFVKATVGGVLKANKCVKRLKMDNSR